MIHLVFYLTLFIFFCVLESFCVQFGLLLPLTLLVLHYFCRMPDSPIRIPFVMFLGFTLDVFYGRVFPFTMLVFFVYGTYCRYSDLRRQNLSMPQEMVVSAILTALVVIPNLWVNVSFSNAVLWPVFSQVAFIVGAITILTPIFFPIFDLLLCMLGLHATDRFSFPYRMRYEEDLE